MSAEPTPAEEPDESNLVTSNLVTGQELEDRLKLFERGLKERLEEERRKRQDVEREAMRLIAEREIERAYETRSRAETEAKWKRSAEWQNRFLAALAGFVLCVVLGSAFSQCNDLQHRLSTLESKQSK